MYNFYIAYTNKSVSTARKLKKSCVESISKLEQSFLNTQCAISKFFKYFKN